MQLLRFNTWMKKALNERKESQRIDYSDWRGFDDSFNEDLSGSDKKNKILLLKKLLSNFDSYSSENEILYQSLDSKKANKDFNFKINTSLNECIDKAIQWYKDFVF